MVSEDRPHACCHFRVELSDGRSKTIEMGFLEVVFPEFRLVKIDDKRELEVAAVNSEIEGAGNLKLRRGVTQSRDLYDWWKKAQQGRAPKRRDLRVSLLTADHSSEVATWIFRRVRPVNLSYTSLHAMSDAVHLETLELAFDAMERC